MATALLYPLSTPHHFSLPSISFFRKQGGVLANRRKCKLDGKIMACSNASLKPTLQNEVFLRRDVMLIGISTSISLIIPCSDSVAEEEVKMSSVVDDINSYSYLYPTELQPKKLVFKWVESRKPERYSSAAPLSRIGASNTPVIKYVLTSSLKYHTADARLRIVSERVDIIDNLIISVAIGPPNAQILKSTDKSTWSAKDVADSVLSDKSALRVTSSQRLAESSVLDAHSLQIDGEPYWYYEYLIRKSPTKTEQEPNLYRQYVAATAERDGYLYSLNASTLSKNWTNMGPVLRKTVESFRLLPPTENYVPPYKDPWRFW